MTIKVIKNDNGRFGQIAIYWIWHGYAILRSKRVDLHGCDNAFGYVLSQVSDSGNNPIPFDSRKLLPAELNYEMHDKERLGIVWALKHCRAFLLVLASPFEVLTNHSLLQYFMTSKILTWCQAHWAKFHFEITYRPGHLATLPDALSCQDEVHPDRGEDFISKTPMNYQKKVKQDEF
ncbi:hypothetical protein O181_128316 [Austropuccinia psidii MF-1]|uniref:Reverse transcriptase RNase H-like domain-containing protein n=1 Tax=Austropuccinia psidii MF-1 TaxID=1389203 RepID=A0A9Q3KXV4_9BASI|nr:hypothetical protein [Austropuccinia psidii MF-1]